MKQGNGGAFTMSSAILREDACIIDDTDDHLVLTVRVSKETILRNHALLACLSDAVSGPDIFRRKEPQAPIKPERKKQPHLAMAALVSLSLALPFIGKALIGKALAGYPPPVQVGSVTPAKPVFKVGENIEIDFAYTRDRVCQTTYDHLIAPDESDTPVFNVRAFGSSVGPTNGEYEVFHLVLKPPAPLSPGRYVYIGYNHSVCAQGGTYDIAYPHVTFTVEP